jgi:O-antigen ligase
VAGSALSLVAIFLALGRGVILSAIIGLFFLGLMMGRKLFAIVVVTVVVLAGAGYALSPALQKRVVDETARDLKGEYKGSRFYIWENCLDIIKENPVMGVGVGNFHREYAARLPEGTEPRRIQGHAHNDWIHVAVVGGIPGLATYVAMWIIAIMLLIQIYRDRNQSAEARAMALAAICGSVVFSSASMTEATFLDEEVRHLLMLIWAVGLWPLYNKGRAIETVAAKEA